MIGKMVTDAELRRLAISSGTRSRDFMLSLPRLILALRTGAPERRGLLRALPEVPAALRRRRVVPEHVRANLRVLAEAAA